ncbi:MAG: SusC/RagA family TonB-linked outer membrane protein [Bacteroidota bacterium]|nr:SusC/RagA family TonB-linked outer membrane protein [Bacteroidota bacterium]
MKKLLLVSLGFLVFFITQASAQNRTITGTVTSKDDGLPLPGVSVTVTGTGIGTQTNGSGVYSISVPASGKSLSFTYISYVKQTVNIGSAGVVNVVLETNARQLGEVVVTGVGVATVKTKVAIDVATVSPKDFAKSATLSVDQALIGQVAGAQVIQQSGKPGSGAQIILRGFTNLNGSNPLIIIDGVQVGNDVIDNIDPSIVDHVEIVKGSAGGMLYGSAGGNGVIQIFTKKGSTDRKLTVDFSSKFGRDQVLQRFPLVAKYHHFDTNAAGQILDSDGNPIAADIHGIWTSPQEQNYSSDPTVQNNKPYKLPVYDHTKQGYHTANTFSNSLNIRGGSEKADYAFSVSNLQQQDVFSNSFSRTNLSLNFGFNIAKGLTFRNSTQVIYTHENLLNGSRFNLVNSYPFINFDYVDPTTGLKTVKPSVDIDGNNSITERDYHSRYNNTPRILESANLNYKFPKFVELDYKYSMDYATSDGQDYYKNQTDSYQQISWGPINGQITDQFSNTRNEYAIASAFLRFDLKNDFHSSLPVKFTTQASYDFRKVDYRYYYAQGTGITPYPPVNVSGASTISAGDGSDYHTLTYGFLVNQTIDWGNLVGISGGFRSDYSSVFGGQSKPFTFPRATVYFNPSELFSSKALVSNWKLRAAFGEAGVQPGTYDRQLTLSSALLGPSGPTIYNQTTARNAELQVQTTKELEIGSDLSLTPFNGSWLSQLTLSGSYWRRTSANDIQNAPVAPSTGFQSILNNLVSLKSNGVDLTLDAKTYKSENFTWDLGLRFATSKTIVTKVSGGIPFYEGAFAVTEGQPLGVLYGQTPLHNINQLKPDGTRYIAAADVANYTLVNGNVVDIRTNRALLTASNDLSNMGNTNPTFTSSMFNRFTIYKKLSVSVQFDWIHGNKIYNQTRQWLYRDRLSRDFDKPVTIAGKTGSFVNYYDSYYNALNPVSWFVEDGSFVRLRDATVSYDITSLVNKKWLRSLIVSVSGRNLLTFTKYTGLDPETTSSLDNQGNAIGGIGNFRGVDDYGQPNVRSYQFSLNVGF